MEKKYSCSSHRSRNKNLGLFELIAIALGGMVGGGIFTVLGISVGLIGALTPIAIIIGGIIAGFAAYSYIKLGIYYKDEGATYSFYKKTFPKSPFAASLIGWYVIFGYISTLALYAYTFASYVLSASAYSEVEWMRKIVAISIIGLFTLINVWSVKGMGKIEDLMVYTKLILLFIISVMLMMNSTASLPTLVQDVEHIHLFNVLIVASLTFVAYEGFQLVINAVNEMDQPEKNIPRAIYTAIVLAIVIYVVISLGAILAIPVEDIIKNKEYALASGARDVLGNWASNLVIVGAVLATSSAISGTVFGASRQMSVIAHDGYFPATLAKRHRSIPANAIITMASTASLLIIIGGLELILEFGSITFLVVSLLMAYANIVIRDKTRSSLSVSMAALLSLLAGTVFIFYYEFTHKPGQMVFILFLYIILAFGAYVYARVNQKHIQEQHELR